MNKETLHHPEARRVESTEVPGLFSGEKLQTFSDVGRKKEAARKRSDVRDSTRSDRENRALAVRLVSSFA